MTRWYARMADIAGLSFEGSPGVDRAKLQGANMRPRTSYGSLSWPTLAGYTSRTPAGDRAHTDLAGMSCAEIVAHTWEGLELPGEPSDYHFILQHAVVALWRRRQQDPKSLIDLETFARLDLQLAEADPRAVSLGGDLARSGWMESVARLIAVLEREGALDEALDIAQRATRFGQQKEKATDLRIKVAALDAEDR